MADGMSDQAPNQSNQSGDIQGNLVKAHDALVDAIQGLQDAGAPREAIGPMVSIVTSLRNEVGKLTGEQKEQPERPVEGQMPPNAAPGAQPAMMQP
jgi:hypothetical protein